MTAERTPRTWGENVWPTAQQLADWLKVCTDAERVTHAYIAIRDGQAHDRCLVQHPERNVPLPEVEPDECPTCSRVVCCELELCEHEEPTCFRCCGREHGEAA